MKINRDDQGRPVSVSWEIGPLPAERDEKGHWWHPGIPWDVWPEEMLWELRALDIEIEIVQMPDDELEELERDGEFPGWDPSPPSGGGWFPLCYQDSEYGPAAFFARVRDDERGGEVKP